MLTPKAPDDKREALQRLRDAVEHKMGYCLNTPTDFNNAAATVTDRTGRPISSTTLMRMWGYVQDGGANYTPSMFTLSTLAIYLGYMDFRQFRSQSKADKEVQSAGFAAGDSVAAEEIPVGTSVAVSWEPDRHCVLRHIRGLNFEVVRAENSKIRVGDIMECVSFTQNAPLCCRQVWRDDELVMSYMAGSKTGIRFRILED